MEQFSLAKIFPVQIRSAMQGKNWQEGLEEIRVRVGQPLEFCFDSGNCYLLPDIRIHMTDIAEMLNYISNIFHVCLSGGTAAGLYYHRGWSPDRTGWRRGDGRGCSDRSASYLFFKCPGCTREKGVWRGTFAISQKSFRHLSHIDHIGAGGRKDHVAAGLHTVVVGRG